MSIVHMEATMRQTYNGKTFRSGEPMDVANEGDAADLVALQMAVRKPPKAAPNPLVPVGREMKAAGGDESSEGDESDEKKAGKNGSYKRRDMQAAR